MISSIINGKKVWFQRGNNRLESQLYNNSKVTFTSYNDFAYKFYNIV